VYTDAAAALAENGTLILYSDGVVERRGEPLEAGMARLLAAADGVLSPEALADRLLETVDPQRPDDVALLVARVHVPEVTPLRMWFAARPDQLAVVREAMRGWLASAGVDRGDGELLVLAAGELCANAVEHAYPATADGSVEVSLSRDTAGTLSLVVRDRGRWRPPAIDPGDRGRGLAIVRGLMSEVEVDGAPEGTTVTVRYRPAGLDAPPVPAGGAAATAIERGPEMTVARLTGEIDELSVSAVEASLAEIGAEPVVVDLSGVAFIGSAGVRLLFALAERVSRLVLVAPADAPFRRALEVAELRRVAELVEAWG
jgi:anti-anti-sigma factor